jgi:hypothetical protein
MLQKNFNLVKEQKVYGLFYVKGFMFGDRFIKIVSDFELNCFVNIFLHLHFKKIL